MPDNHLYQGKSLFFKKQRNFVDGLETGLWVVDNIWEKSGLSLGVG